jgi:uncharacterized protein (TIGR00251 family)
LAAGGDNQEGQAIAEKPMNAQRLTIRENSEGLIFQIRVQPRSSKNRVVGQYGDALKICLTAPPVDNAANKACRAFIADLLSVAKSEVEILSGHTGRNKQIMIYAPKRRWDEMLSRTRLRRWQKGRVLSWIFGNIYLDNQRLQG